MSKARPKLHRLLSACVLAVSISTAQPYASAQAAAIATSSQAYDVMTIKPNKSSNGSSGTTVRESYLSATNVSLKRLLSQAYDIKVDFVSGITGPVESARFDIEAKISDPDPVALKKMTPEQERQMLLPLLTDRFQLKTHIEVRTLPVYELIVAKGGPRFKPSVDQAADNEEMSTNGSRNEVKLTARKASMKALAKTLSSRTDRTVIDMTGLTGIFDFELQWARDDNPDSGAEQLPTIFTAIQEQLGLKLQPGKGPVETLVVDHAEMPSEN